MKKIKACLLLVIMVTFLTSCSNSDDNSNSEEANFNGSLIGTWLGDSSSLNGQSLGKPDNDIITFKSDNSVEFKYTGFGVNGQDISEFGKWTYVGKTLTITWNNADPDKKTAIYTITELSSKNLKWETVIKGEGTLKETFIKK